MEKKICDCSFIYLTVSKVLNCGWQWLNIAYYFNVALVLMSGNVLHVIQIMHINSVLYDINQATLKSENYVLPVFIHSVNSWNNKCCILAFIKGSLRWIPDWRHLRVQLWGWGSGSVEKGASTFINRRFFIWIGWNILIWQCCIQGIVKKAKADIKHYNCFNGHIITWLFFGFQFILVITSHI